MAPVLTAENLRFIYGDGTPFRTTALDGVDLTIEQGETLGIIGHTGSGKSTFIQHLNALLKPTEGRVLLHGEDINSSAEASRSARTKVGLVFQYPEYQLFEETVWRDIAFGPKNMRLSEGETAERVRSAAEAVGIDESLFELSPLELSGGQKRRVAIAGVLAMHPEVLILDEPTAGLDPAGRESIMKHIDDWKRSSGASVVLVSHSMEDVARFADRLAVFQNGKIVMNGTAREIFSHTAALCGMGLAVPAAAMIADALRARGIALPQGIFTVSELASAVKEAASC